MTKTRKISGVYTCVFIYVMFNLQIQTKPPMSSWRKCRKILNVYTHIYLYIYDVTYIHLGETANEFVAKMSKDPNEHRQVSLSLSLVSHSLTQMHRRAILYIWIHMCIYEYISVCIDSRYPKCIHVYMCIYVYTSKFVYTSSLDIPNVYTYICIHMYTHPNMCTNLHKQNDHISWYLKYVHTHIFLYVYTSTYVYLYIWIHMCMYLLLISQMYTCTYVFMCIHIQICVYIFSRHPKCIHVYMCSCVRIKMCVHIKKCVHIKMCAHIFFPYPKCVYIYTYSYVYTSKYVYKSFTKKRYLFSISQMCTHTYIFVCVHIQICVRYLLSISQMCTHMYIFVCVHIQICVHISSKKKR